MSASLRSPVVGLVVAAVCLYLPEHALAREPQETCGGYNVTWPSAFYIRRNTCSIPDPGSRYNAISDQMSRWRNVGGMRAMVYWSAYTQTNCIIDPNDEINEIAFVPTAQIDGNGGRAIMTTDDCWLPGDEDYDSVKIFIAADVGGTVGQPEPEIPSSAVGNGYLRHTILHELGHAHGLDHENVLNIMTDGSVTGNAFGRLGGDSERIDVWPDDAKGGRALYPDSGSEVNIFATGQCVSNGNIYNGNGQRRTIELDACPGGVWATTFGAGNNGTTTVSFVERFYISTSSTSWSGTGGTSLSFYNGVYGKETMFTLVKQFTMPNVGIGTYYLYHAVDYNDQVNEGRESDNVSRHAIRLKVQSWCF